MWLFRWRSWAASITGPTRKGRRERDWRGADVPLEVQLAKRLPEFTLEVSFSSGHGSLSVLGSSGAGKSMLLRCIAGLDRPDRGRIALNGRVLLDTQRGV